MTKKRAKIGYLAVSKQEKSLQAAANMKMFNEAFKGQVDDKPVQLMKDLGAEHPFNFTNLEKINTNIGIVNAGVDKIVDAIVGDFAVKVEDPKAQEIVDGFNKDSSFRETLKPYTKEGILKGNAYYELTELKDNKIRVLNANKMYIKRNKTGEVKKYNQFNGNINRVTITKENTKPFEPTEIAHFTVNKIPNDPYGIGLVWPNLRTIENFASAELGLHKLMDRKAGAPIHVKIGQPGESVQEGDIDDFKKDLQFMNNSTEWVTDGNIEMKLIDFEGVGKNLTELATHDLELLAIGMKVPMSIFGLANIPEGLAKTDRDNFKVFIKSVRRQLEKVLEDKIYRPLLRSNDLASEIEFTWELADEDEIDKRLAILNTAIANPMLSAPLRAALEIQYADVLGLEEMDNLLIDPKDAEAEAERIRKEEEEIKQPEVPGEKPTAKQSANKTEPVEISISESVEHTEEELDSMELSEYVNITEIAGFNYPDYLVKIIQHLRTEKFTELLALTEQDVIRGLLPKTEIDKLRVILTDSFRKNKTIKQIEKQIQTSLNLKDRIKIENGEETVTLPASKRPNVIARTEATRAANAGLKDLYTENNIKSYRYLAALDDRTSDICNQLNAQVFLVRDGIPGTNMPPMHANCRSTIVGLID